MIINAILRTVESRTVRGKKDPTKSYVFHKAVLECPEPMQFIEVEINDQQAEEFKAFQGVAVAMPVRVDGLSGQLRLKAYATPRRLTAPAVKAA